MSKNSHRSKSRWWHLLLVPIVILPFELRLTPIATAKVVIERLCSLFHLRSDMLLILAKKRISIRGDKIITFTLRDPNLRMLGFFSILLVLCFLLNNGYVE